MFDINESLGVFYMILYTETIQIKWFQINYTFNKCHYAFIDVMQFQK